MKLPNLQHLEAQEREEIELLYKLRVEEWMQDLWRFSTECLGNNVETAQGLAGVNDPAVREYITKAGSWILDWLDSRHRQHKRRKMMFIVPRECYKSTLITQSVPVWLAMHDPDTAGIIDCAKLDMAQKMLAVVQEHFSGSRRNSKLITHFGEMVEPGLRWNQREITIAPRRDRARKDPTAWTTGVEIGSTGAHVDWYLMDDPVTQELATDTWYELCWRHYLGTLPVVKKNGLFILVATRYGDSDLVGRIIEREIEPAARRLYGRAEFPEEEFRKRWWDFAEAAGWQVIFRQVHDEKGNCVFPVVWPEERIQEIRDVDEAEYASQLQNMPGSRADSPIDEELIESLYVDVTDVPRSAFNKVTVHMDLAWKNEDSYMKQKGDYSCIQVWLHDVDGIVYYWDGWRGKELMREGFRRQWQVMMQGLYMKQMDPWIMTYDASVGGEQGASEAWFRGEASKSGFFCPPILQLRRTTKKVSRILMAARYWRDRRVRLVRGAGDLQELVYEMLNIGYSQHDDMADAAADVFNSEIYRPGRMNPGRGADQELPEDQWVTVDQEWVMPTGDPDDPYGAGVLDFEAEHQSW